MINKDAGLAVSLWSNDAVEITSVPFKFKVVYIFVELTKLHFFYFMMDVSEM